MIIRIGRCHLDESICALRSGDGLRDDAVELWPPGGQRLQSVSPRHVDDLVAIRPFKIKLCVNDLCFLAARLDYRIAHAIDDFGSADELPAALCADAVDGGKMQVIFAGPGVDDKFGGAPRA